MYCDNETKSSASSWHRDAWAIAQCLARCASDPVKAAIVGSTPGPDRVKGHFSILLIQYWCRFVSAHLAFVPITH